MDLQESADEQAFRIEVREFVARELPAEIRDRVLGFRRVEREDYVRWQRLLNARGWGAPGWPVEHGGTGWSAMQRVIFEEECFRGGAPRQMPFGLSMIGPVLIRFGTEAQRSRFLPRIRSFDDWWCQGYSEPGAGSDLASLQTRAERDGDVYVVNGQKTWTSFAHWANWIFCLVRTRGDGKPQAGISFLLIDMSSPGVRVRPIRTLDQGADVNEVFFDEVRVPIAQRIGEEHGGWAIAKYLLGHERTNIAGIGMCQRLLRRLQELARAPANGAAARIDDPRFRDRLAQLDIEVRSHRWSLMRLISLERSGQPIGTEASILKIRGSEIQQDLGELLMECAGAYALPYAPAALASDSKAEVPADPLLNALAAQYFDLRKVSIYGGTSEVQKNLIAKALLGL
jgi:alkylation response protein AidB-like acyl-CoA dehydrogenase